MTYEPAEKGRPFSVIGALTIEGGLGGMEVEGSVNGDVFEAFIEQMIIPVLRPGHVVLLDHVPFHHREGGQEPIEANGGQVIFLPPYSPEFNPIEACWAKIKAWIRKRLARTVDALQETVSEALEQITRRDAHGWFRHAGYQVQS